MNQNEKHPEQQEFDAPPALREDLAALFAGGGEVPAEVDERIRAMAEAKLGGKPSRPALRWLWPVAAAAAVLLIVMWPQPIHHEPPAPSRVADTKSLPAEAPAFALSDLKPRGDIDGSGRIDILDAFALARRIELREALKPEWDINRDGRVDSDDVDAIAKNAVSLSRAAVNDPREGDIR